MADTPELIVATDMCPVAEFRGHLPRRLASIPIVLYMHEHQFGYPTPHAAKERDEHLAMTNIMSVLAADGVWWNSRYTLESFLDGARSLLRRMPPPRMRSRLDAVEGVSRVLSPGVDDELFTMPRRERASVHLLWNARWEYDKGADVVATALEMLAERGVAFTCDLVGPATGEDPSMAKLRGALGERVIRFGRQSQDGYRAALAEADVVLSAARHEFFGIAIVEAVASGAVPVVPRGLAYPEVLADVPAIWHDGTGEGLCEVLARACEERSREVNRNGVGRYAWSERASELDTHTERVILEQNGA